RHRPMGARVCAYAFWERRVGTWGGFYDWTVNKSTTETVEICRRGARISCSRAPRHVTHSLIFMDACDDRLRSAQICSTRCETILLESCSGFELRIHRDRRVQHL